METNDNKDLGDKKWNNGQKGNTEQERNEGFSGENIPDNYNPSGKTMHSEDETDESGNKKDVDRARYSDGYASKIAPDVDNPVDNSAIRNKKSVENRDHNYDTDASRYKDSHPENRENRGNITLDED